VLFEWIFLFLWVGINVNKRQQVHFLVNNNRFSEIFGFRVFEKDSGYRPWLWLMLYIVFTNLEIRSSLKNKV